MPDSSNARDENSIAEMPARRLGKHPLRHHICIPQAKYRVRSGAQKPEGLALPIGEWANIHSNRSAPP